MLGPPGCNFTDEFFIGRKHKRLFVIIHVNHQKVLSETIVTEVFCSNKSLGLNKTFIERLQDKI